MDLSPHKVLVLFGLIFSLFNRSGTGDILVKCNLGNSSTKGSLHIFSSMIPPDQVFAGVNLPVSDHSKIACAADSCRKLNVSSSTFIKGQTAFVSTDNICGIPNGTTFSCVLVYSKFTTTNTPGNTNRIYPDQEKCSALTTTTMTTVLTQEPTSPEVSDTVNSTTPLPPTKPWNETGNHTGKLNKKCSNEWTFNSLAALLTVLLFIVSVAVAVVAIVLYKIKKRPGTNAEPAINDFGLQTQNNNAEHSPFIRRPSDV